VRWIAPSTERDGIPRWSPDGRQLAFVRIAGFERRQPVIPVRLQPWAVWLADAQTGKARAGWTSGAGARDSLPASFEADLFFFAGARLVFASEQDGRMHLYSIDAAGAAGAASAASAARRLTTGDYDVEQARPAPDGRSILFTSNQ